MLGAIAGDIIGSPYEFEPHQKKSTEFPLFIAASKFTDDSVLTVATADALFTDKDYAEAYLRYFNLYPGAGYGGRFAAVCYSGELKPYNSFGNGSAMRVSPVGWVADTLEETLAEAKRSADVSHNHPEGVKGAQATAGAIFLARTGSSKPDIRAFVVDSIGYDLSRTLDQIRPGYTFNETCQKTVPEAITAFLESNDFEDAIRKAVSLGGDCDTLTCITGGIAEAYYGGVPAHIADEVWKRIPSQMADVTRAFREKYITAG